MCVPSWPRTEDLCAFLSAAFDNARPKPVDIFLPPLRLPPVVVLFVVSLPLDDVFTRCVFRDARVFVLEETSRLAAALKLHFSRERAETTFSKHRERRASFRREKNTEGEKREREFYITVLDRAHKIDTLVREKSASFSSHRFSGKSIERIESHREE